MHALCPYFAMFPESFVREHVLEYTESGDTVFDPFSGRGTTLFEALLQRRKAAAVDINPVAYCVTGAKACAPGLAAAIRAIDELEEEWRAVPGDVLAEKRRSLPPFFGRAFHWTTLEQLLFLRDRLNWRRNKTHRFIAALALGSMHGERDKPMKYFSNQMPRTISTKPEYSLGYWREHGLWPHKRNVFQILRERADFRLRRGMPTLRGEVVLGDARDAAQHFPKLGGRVRCVITSPPYLDVTNSEEDQWLRLWFLGNGPNPTYRYVSSDNRYVKPESYWGFLSEAWQGVAPLMQRRAVVVCRMGGRGIDEGQITDGLQGVLASAFAKVDVLDGPRMSPLRNRQARAFRPGAKGCTCEWDYVLEVTPASQTGPPSSSAP